MTNHGASHDATPRIHPERKQRVRTALTAFSICAYVTGIMLLVLCTRMILEYLVGMDLPTWARSIGIIHGWCYMAFALATINLGVKARWEPKWWLATMAGGVVPFLSFFVEHNRRKQVTARFQLDQQ